MAGLTLVTPAGATDFTQSSEKRPQRIVSLAPAITETLFALGLGSRVVGVSTYCDFPAQARALPKVGSFSEPVAEAIVALKPDLVLTSPSPGNETTVRAIQATGIEVEVVKSEGGIAEARAAMLDAARFAGAEAAGAALVSRIDSRLSAVKTAARSLPHPSVAVVIGREPLVLAGPDSYLGELVALAGGSNIAEPVGGRWPRVSMEFLVAAAPDVLVDLAAAMGDGDGPQGSSDAGGPAAKHGSGGSGTGAEKGAAPGGSGKAAGGKAAIAAGSGPGQTDGPWARLTSIPAVANGRIVAPDSALMLRPGPRLADAAEALFAALHPGASLPRPAMAE
ncbi:MAG TPA: ABC transporter substrate-binding protein [Candidatus Binatia bacterium]